MIWNGKTQLLPSLRWKQPFETGIVFQASIFDAPSYIAFQTETFMHSSIRTQWQAHVKALHVVDAKNLVDSTNIYCCSCWHIAGIESSCKPFHNLEQWRLLQRFLSCLYDRIIRQNNSRLGHSALQICSIRRVEGLNSIRRSTYPFRLWKPICQ